MKTEEKEIIRDRISELKDRNAGLGLEINVYYAISVGTSTIWITTTIFYFEHLIGFNRSSFLPYLLFYIFISGIFYILYYLPRRYKYDYYTQLIKDNYDLLLGRKKKREYY